MPYQYNGLSRYRGLGRGKGLNRGRQRSPDSTLARTVPLRPGDYQLATVTPLTRNRGLQAGHAGTSRRGDRPPPGFPWDVKLVIHGRDGGQCVLAGWGDCWGPLHPHHRRPVGMGGTSLPGQVHVPSNGITLCAAHHDWVHTGKPVVARVMGLLVPRSSPVTPADRRITFDHGETWWWLYDDGRQLRRPPWETT